MENTFGILSSRFRVLRSPLLQNFKNSVETVKATVTLHNYILKNCNQDGRYLNQSQLARDEGLDSGRWEDDGRRLNLHSLGHLSGNRSGTKGARDQREMLAQMMMTDELAPWQFERAFRSK